MNSFLCHAGSETNRYRPPMRKYTLAELVQPATYAADPQLATLARRIAEKRTDLSMPVGERKRLALAGGMVDDVLEAVTRAWATDAAEATEEAAHRAALAGIALPAGWSMHIGASTPSSAAPLTSP